MEKQQWYKKWHHYYCYFCYYLQSFGMKGSLFTVRIRLRQMGFAWLINQMRILLYRQQQVVCFPQSNTLYMEKCDMSFDSYQEVVVNVVIYLACEMNKYILFLPETHSCVLKILVGIRHYLMGNGQILSSKTVKSELCVSMCPNSLYLNLLFITYYPSMNYK